MTIDSIKTELYDDARKFKIDDFDGAITIDLPHHEIHEGNHFSGSSVATSIADSGKIKFYISIPSGYKVHTLFDAASGGDSTFRLFEGCVTSSKGTAITSYNWNRTSTRTSGVSLWCSPIVTSSGTTLFETYLPGGTKTNAIGAQLGTRSELILAPSRKYLLTLINNSGVAKSMCLGANWYEEAV